jgi:hypothetical protein
MVSAGKKPRLSRSGGAVLRSSYARQAPSTQRVRRLQAVEIPRCGDAEAPGRPGRPVVAGARLAAPVHPRRHSRAARRAGGGNQGNDGVYQENGCCHRSSKKGIVPEDLLGNKFGRDASGKSPLRRPAGFPFQPLAIPSDPSVGKGGQELNHCMDFVEKEPDSLR